MRSVSCTTARKAHCKHWATSKVARALVWQLHDRGRRQSPPRWRRMPPRASAMRALEAEHSSKRSTASHATPCDGVPRRPKPPSAKSWPKVRRRRSAEALRSCTTPGAGRHQRRGRRRSDRGAAAVPGWIHRRLGAPRRGEEVMSDAKDLQGGLHHPAKARADAALAAGARHRQPDDHRQRIGGGLQGLQGAHRRRRKGARAGAR
jgi:hypothetical protein